MMRAYRWLLHLLPRSFAADYADEMTAILRLRLGQARGPFARAGVWLEAVSDVAVTAVCAHADILRQDVRQSVRAIAHMRGFAATVVVVAALGIGATTAAFSVADHVLARPLPFEDAERLVKLWQDESFRGYARMELSPPNYRDWRERSAVFSELAAYTERTMSLTGDGPPERLVGTFATGEFFDALRVAPFRGRVFGAADDRDGVDGVLVLSYSLWQGRFGGDPGVLGRRVLLDDAPYTVVGIMPPSFFFPRRDTQFWSAMRFGPGDFEDRRNNYLQAVGRLRPGVTLEQTQAEMTSVAAQLEREHPEDNARVGATVRRLRDEVSQQSRLLLMGLVGASICVLLIACTNLANLLLTRALSRQRELAVRLVLGAGRHRLLRQMLTESALLAGSGGILGVVLAGLAAPLVAQLVPTTLPIAEAPQVDMRMLAMAALMTMATGLGFGVVPALRASRSVVASGLNESARVGASRRTERLRAALVVAEVAACIVLLVAAGLLVRALLRVQNVEPGFVAENVLTMRTWLPTPKYERTEVRTQFYDQTLERIRAIPGVASAAYASFLPMVMRGGIWPVTIEGAIDVPEDSRAASLRFVTPTYFATMGIPLLRGRDVSERDTAESPFVAVISDSFAEQYWPGDDPLGKRFRIAFDELTVVGVAGHVRVRGLERPSEPQVYMAYRQVRDGALIFYTPKDLVVKFRGDPGRIVPAVRRVVGDIDPGLPVADVRLLDEIVGAETEPRLAQLRVLGTFGATAFLLAAIGIHGLLAFSVSARTREFGVRIALGARPGDVLRIVLGRAALLALSGAALGLLGAYLAGRALQALLAGVSPTDAPTMAVGVALAVVMTLLGSLRPATRAVRIDPTVAMRAD